jgi:dolichyl-phosphate-mannose-protein mannosyltransferase
LLFVPVKERDLANSHAQVLKKSSGPPRVLSGDQINRPQNSTGPLGEVFEIADRSPNQVQGAAHAFDYGDPRAAITDPIAGPPVSSASVDSDTQIESVEEPVRPARSDRHRRRRFYHHPIVAILAVSALAGGVRFYHLSQPSTYIFDEVYYAKDGCYDAGYPYRQCKLKAPYEQTFTVHPPLGRWIIAGGVKAYGNRPFGWRIAPAVAGTISVFLVALLALALFESAAWAAAAGVLLGTEALNFVQSRTSMIDIFVAMLVLAGFLFLVLDRKWIDRRTPALRDPLTQNESIAEEEEDELLVLPPDRAPSPIFRPWRLATGVAFGLATATKWSGGPPLVAAIVLAVLWERSRRTRLGLRHPLLEALRDESFGIFWFLIVLPVAVYMGSYINWFWHHGFNLAEWWDTQRRMASFSLGLRSGHPYSSRPWTWLAMERPVAYYYRCIGVAATCRPSEILAIGNPIIFWGSVIVVPYTLVVGIMRRDWRAALIVAAFASQYFPWFLAKRTSFIFYMTPVTPFMVLAWVYLLRDTRFMTGRLFRHWRWEISPVAAAIMVLSVAAFIFFFPVLTAAPISHTAWQARMWFRSWI